MDDFKGYGPAHEHALKKHIADAIAGADTLELAVEYVMEALNEARVISYHNKRTLALLTQTGRAFVVLIEYPESSIRDVASKMGVLENTAKRSMTKLLDNGLVERQKRKNTFTYTPRYESVWQHPDVWRFALAILKMSKEQPDSPW
jgi:hypothetical protein